MRIYNQAGPPRKNVGPGNVESEHVHTDSASARENREEETTPRSYAQVVKSRRKRAKKTTPSAGVTIAPGGGVSPDVDFGPA